MTYLNLVGVAASSNVTFVDTAIAAASDVASSDFEAASFIGKTHQPLTVLPPTFTAGSAVNGLRFGCGYSPITHMSWAVCDAVDGADIILPAYKLSNYLSYQPALLIGGEIEARRITNGVMQSIGIFEIIDARFKLESLASGGDQILTDTSFEYVFSAWNEEDTPYWFSVSAVDASGNIGPRSQWASCTPSTTGGGAARNDVESLSLTDAAAELTAPETVSALTEEGAGTAVIEWSGVSNAAGYVVYIGFSDPQAWPESGDQLTIDCGRSVQAGDLITWRKNILKPVKDYMCSRVVGSAATYNNLMPKQQPVGKNPLNLPDGDEFWELKEFDETYEKPNDDIGPYFLEHVTKAGATSDIGHYWQAGSGQTFYYVRQEGEVFCTDAWVWLSEAATLHFTAGSIGESTQIIELKAGWQYVQLRSEDFTPDTGTTPRRWSWKLSAASEDLVARYAQRKSYIEGQAYGELPEATAKDLVAGQFWRDHALIKTNGTSYDMTSALAPIGEGFGGWSVRQHFEECVRLDLNPWTQIEFSMRDEEMLAYLELVNEYIEHFDRVKLEFSNETWNGLAAFLTMPAMVDSGTGDSIGDAEVYGMMQNMFYRVLQTSPYWDAIEPKLDLVIGGRNGFDYGERAWAHSTESREVDVAAYNGGWDVNTNIAAEDGATFAAMQQYGFEDSALTAREEALALAAQAAGKTVGVDVFHNIYEAGPGYQLDGLNGASLTDEQTITQEVVKKSRASALSMVSSYCNQALRGWRYNYFRLSQGDNWTSHREDGAEYLPYTVMMEPARRLGAFKSYDVSDFTSTQTDDVQDVDVYAMQSEADEGHWLLAIVNRKVDKSILDEGDDLYDPADDGTKAVNLFTPFTSASTCAVMRAGIGNPRAHNRYPEGTRLQEDGSYVDDALCVEFDASWTSMPVPENMGRFAIDAALGVDSAGLRGGNFLFIEFKGVA
jgi:hypothetical protein